MMNKQKLILKNKVKKSNKKGKRIYAFFCEIKKYYMMIIFLIQYFYIAIFTFIA